MSRMLSVNPDAFLSLARASDSHHSSIVAFPFLHTMLLYKSFLLYMLLYFVLQSRFLLVFGKKGAANLEFTKLTCNPTDELKGKNCQDKFIDQSNSATNPMVIMIELWLISQLHHWFQRAYLKESLKRNGNGHVHDVTKFYMCQSEFYQSAFQISTLDQIIRTRDLFTTSTSPSADFCAMADGPESESVGAPSGVFVKTEKLIHLCLAQIPLHCCLFCVVTDVILSSKKQCTWKQSPSETSKISLKDAACVLQLCMCDWFSWATSNWNASNYLTILYTYTYIHIYIYIDPLARYSRCKTCSRWPPSKASAFRHGGPHFQLSKSSFRPWPCLHCYSNLLHSL